MRIFHRKTITEDILRERIGNEVEGNIVNYKIISSKRQKKLYEIKSKLYDDYLKHVHSIIKDVGDFIRAYLPKFSSRRKDFDYIRSQCEFLINHEILLKVSVKTDKEERLLDLSFEQPSFVSIPVMQFGSYGQYIYIYDHLKSRISFMIGDPENLKTDDYLVDDAMEELWHVAIYPYLIEKENKSLRLGKPLDDTNFKKKLVQEGERLSRLFTFASFYEFKLKKGYENVTGERKPDEQEEFLVGKIARMGIKRGLKEVAKPEGALNLKGGQCKIKCV